MDGSASSRTGGGARQRFRIQFQSDVVVEAADIRDALRQAESLRPTVITAVARIDKRGRQYLDTSLGACAGSWGIRTALAATVTAGEAAGNTSRVFLSLSATIVCKLRTLDSARTGKG